MPKGKRKIKGGRKSKSNIPKKSIAKKEVPKKISKKEVSPPDISESESTSETKVRRPRRKVTLETHLQKYDGYDSVTGDGKKEHMTGVLEILDKEIDRRKKEREKGIRIFQTIRKLIRELRKEAPKIANSKRRVNTGGNKVSGFVLKCQITDELADFMGISRGSTPSRNEITNAICTYIHVKPGEKRPQMLKWEKLNPGGKRNLQNPDDKMTIVPDKKLIKLLRYEQYKKNVADGKVSKNITNKETRRREKVQVTDNSLKYWVAQKLFQRHITKTIRLKKSENSEEDESKK